MHNIMRRFLPFVAMLALVAGPTFAGEPASPTADEIMAKVAANQDRTEAARAHYIYQQHIRIASRRGSRVMCEEVTDSRVSPQAKELHETPQKELLTLDGRLWHKGQYLHYTKLPDGKDEADDINIGIGDDDPMDRDLVEDLRKDLADDKSKDGLGKGLFPLTTEQQSQYLFKLKGRQTMNGRDVYHLSFRPKDKDDYGWNGEAFIDAREFEPVVVYTVMSRKIPLAVRTLLGTNLPGLGFSVTYDRQPDGVWFPVSFGTEFHMRVLFFLARDISMSLANTHFEKTHTNVRILDGVKLADGAVAPTAVH